MAITRGIKIYDVWAGDGEALANPSYGITLEDWNGTNVAVMTILESGKVLSEEWDSGYSSDVDARSYPKNGGGSGGTIELLDDGWYNSFLSSGYSLEGSRVERLWNDDPFSQHYIDKVGQEIGSIKLSLLSLDDKMNTNVTNGDQPLIVGEWKGAELEKIGSDEEVLFDGMTFRCGSAEPYITYDEYGAPFYYQVNYIPTDPTFSLDFLDFPNDRSVFARIVSGKGEGSIFEIKARYAQKQGTSGSYYFQTALYNSRGITIDDDYPLGLVFRLQDALSPSELSVWEYVSFTPKYKYDSSSTIQTVYGDGNKLTSYTLEDGILYLDNQTEETNTIYVDAKNSTEDLRQFFDNTPSKLENVYAYPIISYYDNTEGLVTDRLSSTYNYIRTEGIGSVFETGIGYDIFTSSDSVKGIQLDVTSNSTAVDRMYVIVIAIWGSTEWDSETYRTIVYQETLEDYIQEIHNTEVSYFTDSDNRVMDAWDDRTPQVSSNPTVHRGRLRFEFPSELGGLMPDKYTVLIRNKQSLSGATLPLETRVHGIALWGDSVSTNIIPDKVTVDIVGRDWSNLQTSITNVANTMDWSSFSSSSVSVPVLPQLVRNYTKQSTELKTGSMLQQLLKEAWCIADIDRNGTYNVVSVTNKIGYDITVPNSHNFVFPHGYELLSNIIAYESDDIPTGGTIKYNRDTSGNYGNSIVITNADKSVYNEEYVTGITDPDIAEEIWNKSHGIWLKTGILNDIRSDLSKLNWIYQENDVIEYILNILEWNGGSNFVKDVRTIKIMAVSIDTVGDTGDGVLWNRGESCRITIPNVLQGEYTGVITGVEYNPDYTAEITMRVAQLTERPSRIIEAGTATENRIIELDSNTDRILEVGL